MTEDIYPETIKVHLNRSKISLPFNSVCASLTHQILSKNARRFEGEHYYMLFESTVIEIKEYLKNKLSSGLEILNSDLPQIDIQLNGEDKIEQFLKTSHQCYFFLCSCNASI